MKHLTFVALLLLGCQTLGFAQYSLTVESSPAATAGLTTYRFYVDLQDATDRVSAVYGNDQASLLVSTPAGAFSSSFNSSWNASGINPAFLPLVPDLADDTYATIGLEGPASTSGLAGAADPSVVEDATQPITPYFLTNGATDLESSTLTGASWYILNTASNGLPQGADLRVLIMQVTTSGTISGQINAQVFPLGVGTDQYQGSTTFDGEGTFPLACVGGACPASTGCTDLAACNYDENATEDDGSCEFTSCAGCMDAAACNYDPAATLDDGSCTYAEANQDCDGNCLVAVDCNGDCGGTAVLDECGTCGGAGIPEGDCDCDGNVEDAAGVCGGDCDADTNGDNICDDEQVSGCTSPAACNYDAAAVLDDGSCDFFSCYVFGCDDPSACNFDDTVDFNDGSCEYLSCIGCQDPSACNYEENAIIAGTCDYDSCAGCTNPEADNYDPTATIDNGSCEIPGCTIPQACNYDADATVNDGSCDLESCLGIGCANPLACNYDPDAVIPDDSCVFDDACGVCDGPGEIYDCGCEDIPSGDCDCDGNQLDALGVCGGSCGADEDADGICDDVDDCIGALDECGVCNGPGAIDECGCSDIPAGDCDCDGSQEDALGVCGGDCAADVDADGICDDEDDCVGALDACGVCNGPGAIYECGCEDIPVGDCDCDGNQLDALGVCGGDCAADVDADGICDDEDDCVGALDACGVCNGPGAIYECGCADIPEGDCDCNGNQEDALGVCGGNCDADVDADGICDDEDDCVGAYDACGICNGDDSSCSGCTNATACNYDETATVDDGSCEFESCSGCTDATACNYDATATLDDGSCEFESCSGCTDATACNYDETATVDDGSCEFESCAGCTDAMACNYDETATIDDGSCLVIGEACDDMDDMTFDDIVNDSCECVGTLMVLGCLDSLACNYDMDANTDDESCEFPGDACDDMDENTENDTLNIDCICVGDTIQDSTDFVFDFERLEFGMFPNPTTGEVTLRVDGFHAGVTMQVMDGAGRVVWSEQNLALQGNTVFDLSRLSAGTYNVMLSDKRGVNVQRLAIQR